MDRIHRLGQKRPVKVVKLVVEDSIEDQIVQLQAKKLAMTDAALSRDPDAALGKLTVEDVSMMTGIANESSVSSSSCKGCVTGPCVVILRCLIEPVDDELYPCVSALASKIPQMSDRDRCSNAIHGVC